MISTQNLPTGTAEAVPYVLVTSTAEAMPDLRRHTAVAHRSSGGMVHPEKYLRVLRVRR